MLSVSFGLGKCVKTLDSREIGVSAGGPLGGIPGPRINLAILTSCIVVFHEGIDFVVSLSFKTYQFTII